MDGVDAIEQGVSDGYSGNALRADLGGSVGSPRSCSMCAVATGARSPPLDLSGARDHGAAGQGASGHRGRGLRAIVKTQRALRADPQLATKAAQRLFPAEEASLIAYEVARDAPFYNPTISEEMVAHISRFAHEIGALEGEVRYGELVATQFADLWHG